MMTYQACRGRGSTKSQSRIEAEYKYWGSYTGGLKDGKPHGRGDFSQDGATNKKHLIGEGGRRQARAVRAPVPERPNFI